MFGFVSKKEALAHGFTHHGSYYGIPIWLAMEGEGVVTLAKWAPLEILMPIFVEIEGLLRSILFPHDDPAFQFTVGEEIES